MPTLTIQLKYDDEQVASAVYGLLRSVMDGRTTHQLVIAARDNLVSASVHKDGPVKGPTIPASVLYKHWVCEVVRSGFHNGAMCSPSDPHDDWGCAYKHEASMSEAQFKRLTE
jgi:hypothetical protein